jgi:glutathione S-transferase
VSITVSMPRLVLYVGDRNYSSWSLRPWLVMNWSGLAFDERLVSLDQAGYGTGDIVELQSISPSGRVPVLHSDDLVLCDSLAISEWIAETVPSAELWPAHPSTRALARSAVCRMHAGFHALRRDLPMNLRRRVDAPAWLRRRQRDWGRDTRADLSQMDAMLSGFRARYEDAGPYLFGGRTIADAVFTPVAARFRTYCIPLDPRTQAYCDLLLSDAAFRVWEDRALAEWRQPFSRATLDDLYTPG